MSPGARRLLIGTGAAMLLVLVFGRAAAVFYTEALWFGSLGHGSVFWTRFAGGLAVRLVVAGAGAAVVLLNLWLVLRSTGPVHVRRRYGNVEIAERIPPRWLATGLLVIAVLAGWWISALSFPTARAMAVLAWFRAPSWGAVDPLFGRDISFFVFTLPILTAAAAYLLLILAWSAALVAAGYVIVGGLRWRANRLEMDRGAREHFAWLGAGLLVLVAARWWIARYLVLLDGSGFGGGVGYTDVHARLPGYAALALLALLTGGLLVHAARSGRRWVALGAGAGLVLGAVLIGGVWPTFVERFQVEPNQLVREAPFVAWRIDGSRRAYGLNRLERRPWDPRVTTPLDAEATAVELERLPLWDTAPLQSALNQVQTLYGYYHFPEVVFDRYPSASGPEQVAIAVREFDADGLPDDARTWRSLHLNPEYRRGWGAVAVSAARTVRAEPEFWLSGLDPVRLDPAAPPSLALSDPRVYFGRTMTGYVLVDAASDTVFGSAGVLARTRPAATGPGPIGVGVGGPLRRLLFAVREGDKNLLFTSELTERSRIVLRRNVVDRVRAVAPFILWSGTGSGPARASFGEPYPVVLDGRVVWIVDGFTVSAWYPVAARQRLDGVGVVSYLQHTVKAVVDGLTGAVALYAMDEDEPVLEAYRRVFPTLIQPAAALPPGLRAHLRYPPAFVMAQAQILDEYHLDDPAAFFAGQDFWQLPGASRLPGASVYRPLQMMTRLPGGTETEFAVVVPFIARERENMTALLVARSDPGVYGELVLLELPRDERIKGPEQIQTIIEQDPEISAQLSLWRQAGSNVDDGQLRIVPAAGRILYVQPLFLSAQAGSIPQLQRVVVSDGTNVAMGVTLRQALEALAGEQGAGVTADGPEGAARQPPGLPPTADWPARALELLEAADARLRVGDFAGFGARWNELQELLRTLAAGGGSG
ncbi:MAG: UPF0182 family protein [Gemmatimonadota bacterium]